MWVPFEDGTSFGQWLDDARTERNLRDLGVVPKDIEGYWAYEHLFDEIRRRLRTGARDTWVGETPTRAEIEELLGGEQTMRDVVFSASIAEVLDDHMSDQRLKDALFGQGVIAAYGGPKDAGTASIKLMHYQGDLEGQGPVWGYVQGGMGMVSFALADAAQEAGAVLACGVPVAAIEPEAGVVLEDGTRIRARTVLCNADPKVALSLLEGQDVPADYRRRLEDWKVRSPVVKFNAALNALPNWTAAPGESWPARATIDVTGGLDDAQRAFEACERGEPAVGFGEVYLQTGYDATPAPAGKHLLSVFGQYAPYDLARRYVGQPPRGGRAPVHRPDRPLRARLRRLHRGLRGPGPAGHRGAHRAHRRQHLPGRGLAGPDVGAPPDAAHAGARPVLLRRRHAPRWQRHRPQWPQRRHGGPGRRAGARGEVTARHCSSMELATLERGCSR